ncbi:hypothetical protein CEXT_69291, partial [Caerostris extrusa]
GKNRACCQFSAHNLFSLHGAPRRTKAPFSTNHRLNFRVLERFFIFDRVNCTLHRHMPSVRRWPVSQILGHTKLDFSLLLHLPPPTYEPRRLEAT